MAPRRHHRFPRGETCSECPARRWYHENGLRYCENGHQVEGYVQFDVDEDDNFGKTGRVARKKKEARRREGKHLAGNEARELFLECLQLLLRKQVLWLVGRRGLHPELEAVVRDLWLLRVEVGAGGGDGDGDGEGNGGGMGWVRKRRSWKGEVWALPGLMDTLGLVYLGCVLRQEPVRIGDLFRWARNGQIPFLGAIDYVPKEWRDRLPGWAHHALLTRYARFHGGELHRSVMDLMLGYEENHGLVFPAIPAAPLLFLYVRDLALPPEVHPFAQKVCRLLDLSYSFPTRGPSPKRYLLLDTPEVLLVASVIVATKHNYPLDGIERLPRDASDPLCLQMDWAVWEFEFKKQPEKKPGILQYEHMGQQEIWSMDKEDMNELLNWFQETQLEKNSKDETEVHRLFPLEDIPPLPEIPEIPQEDIEEKVKRVQSAMKRIEPRADTEDMGDSTGRLGSEYRSYKDVDELGGTVKRFFEVAAEAAGLSLGDLVRAVYGLEQLLMNWQRREKRRLKRGEGVGDGTEGA
ncbi:hypothetical protein N658DRAFT_450300 [Parathielavia hyrcaniae]|uniref:RRN7-type domain-containing protein n=1 Tax=Parathielavia hyrcaniae TaxID=113614 RepID=A0AAN6T0Q4_9PEZI|nr:hypothetical protein N658DRAFT_450300 [Parathielavia hyrcaniae]